MMVILEDIKELSSGQEPMQYNTQKLIMEFELASISDNQTEDLCGCTRH